MSDALPLPPRPNLEQYKKLAKDFQRACKSSDSSAIRQWAARWVETITRLQGVEITPQTLSEIHREAERIEQRWHKFKKTDDRGARCLLADAQFFVAREHGFASWPKFAAHVETLTRGNSPVANFEAAVDAIISGDTATLRTLLHKHPELVRARSTREHRSTLLHYVSANGVEDFRQKTPKNTVEIAEMLLKAGADVNAESEAYGGFDDARISGDKPASGEGRRTDRTAPGIVGPRCADGPAICRWQRTVRDQWLPREWTAGGCRVPGKPRRTARSGKCGGARAPGRRHALLRRDGSVEACRD